MAEDSGISWTDNTFNPLIGCTKVSPACKYCYAERDMDKRLAKAKWGDNGTRVLTTDTNWRKPIWWNNKAAKDGKRVRVFCASLSDVFELWTGPITNHHGQRLFWSHSREPHQSKWHWIGENDCAGDEKPVTMDDVRARLFELIDATPNLDWLVLTKRPQNIETMMYDPDSLNGWVKRKNLWLGTTAENQQCADERVPKLLECRHLAEVLFLSCEPMLGPIDLCYPPSLYPNGPDKCCSGFECGCRGLPTDPPAWLGKQFADKGGIDWVIAGGESGPDARPSHPDWFRSLRNQCKSTGVPFHFKQWGEYEYKDVTGPQKYEDGTPVPPEHEPMSYVRVGVKAAGRLLDGVLHDEFPIAKNGGK